MSELFREAIWLKSANLTDEWPRISIVTPSFNQAKFLEPCIDSILSQGYPNLEYIIMDGGSSDGSVEIIKRYQKYLTFWQSQPDGGHYRAVEAGFKRATGEVMGYLNSDDMLHPKGLFAVGNVFRSKPEVSFITGLRIGFDKAGQRVKFGFEEQRWNRNFFLERANFYNPMLMIMQESTYWRRSLWEKSGSCFDHKFGLAGDFEMWARFLRHAQLYTVNFEIGGFRYHGENQRSESHRMDYLSECLQVIERERIIKSDHPELDGVAPPTIEGALSRPFIRSKRPKPATVRQIRNYATTLNPKYPKISIVTPSLNQAEYLEECIDSVLSQDWPNLEYVVMDGGSTDGSKEIIERYSKYLTYWRSEPDGGQYSAIDDGFKRTSGTIMAWVNADDKLHARALHIVASFFQKYPQSEWVSGRPNGFNDAGELDWILMFLPHFSRAMYLRKIFTDPYIQQESIFWKRSLWEKAGGYVDSKWKFAGDLELWTRFFRHSQLWVLNMLLGGFRKNPAQRSDLYYHRYLKEGHQILDREYELFIDGTYDRVLAPPDPIIQL